MTRSPWHPKFWWLFACAWLVLASAYALMLYAIVPIDRGSIVFEAAASFLMILPVLILSLVLPRFYFPARTWYVYVLVISAALAYVFSWLTHELVFNRIWPLRYSNSVFGVRTFTYFVLILSVLIGGILWNRSGEKEEAGKRQAEINEKMRDAELHKLQHQLQPHFLFNSLNSINALIQIEPQQARDMVQKLSDFLRFTLKRADEQWVSLEHEMDYLNLYLDIEKIRFRHRLELSVNLSPQALPHLIPTLILQPVVENAIKFGLYGTTGNVRITLNAVVRNNQVQVTVTNPFDTDMLPSNGGTGFGLKAIGRRLQLLYNRNDLLQTRHHENIYTTVLNIPIKKDEGNINR